MEVRFYINDPYNLGNDAPIDIEKRYADEIRELKHQGREHLTVKLGEGIIMPVGEFYEIH